MGAHLGFDGGGIANASEHAAWLAEQMHGNDGRWVEWLVKAPPQDFPVEIMRYRTLLLSDLKRVQ